jgi:hypothetical protein
MAVADQARLFNFGSETPEFGPSRDVGVSNSGDWGRASAGRGKIGTLADSGGTACNRASPISSVCHSRRAAVAGNDFPESLAAAGPRQAVEEPVGYLRRPVGLLRNRALWKRGVGGSIPLVKTEIQYIGIPS